MGSKSSAPPPPDYAALLPQQEAMNQRSFQQMVQASRVNTSGPQGNQTWSQDPQGQWTMNTQLSPELQGLNSQDLRIRGQMGNIGEGMLGNVASTYGQPANFAGMLGDHSIQYDAGSRNRAEKAFYDRGANYLLPQFDRQESNLHNRLTGQGFNLQDNAYGQEMSDLGDTQNRALSDLRNSAIQFGGNEASQELGRGIQAGQYNTNQDLERIGLAGQDRSRLINELNAFRTGQQIQGPTGQTSVQAPNLASPDLLNATNQTYQGQVSAANASNKGSSDMFGGLLGLAGATSQYWMPALMAMSDERLKENFTKVGETTGGRNLYTWTWKDNGSPGFGIVAQENPDISVKLDSGLFAVDYSKVN